MLIYLLRHGRTEYNAQKRYQGQRDIPLSAESAAKLRRADFSPEIVYVTPLQRTSQTAKILFPEAKLVPVEGLKEMNFGRFEGQKFVHVEQDPEYLAWVAENETSAHPDGERKSDFAAASAQLLRNWSMKRWKTARNSLSSWPTAAPRWRPWSASPCRTRASMSGAAPTRGAMCWMPVTGRRSGSCTS